MSRESELIPNSWSDEDASNYIQKYAKHGEDVALRVYTSRLIGRDPNLVLHGGGNTSVKLVIKNIVGENKNVIAIKGSGWDMANIEPQGFPLVDLDHCKKLRNLPKLSDEEMVNQLRTHMEDFTSPTPSVETLLHAFLPHKFVDHSHADAVLAIVDQPNAEKICRELYGDEFGIVPYIMPGFELSLLASNVFNSNNKVKGLILLKHGLFTFAETAKESYLAHIEAVNRAQRFIFAQPQKPLSFTRHRGCPHCTSDLACKLFPILRGIFHSKTKGTHWLLTYRPSPAALEFCNSDQVEDWSHRGTLTPDHVIRTKAFPLVLKSFEDILESESKIQEFLVQKVESYIQEYHDYFSRQNEKSEIKKTELDPIPRVILIEHLGLVTVGQTYSECTIAADIYEHTISTIKDAMAVGSYDPVNEQERFGMEYWSLEQAKLGKTQPPALGGRVVYITGAASGIGYACAEVFGKLGANLVVVDIDSQNLENAAKKLKASKFPVHFLQADATKVEEVQESFKKAVLQFGGIDILISNAGKAYQSEIAQCSPELLQQSLNVNLIAHQYCASSAVSVMIQQNNVSKAAVNPGKNFGPYAIAKAAEMALMKQYALEYAQYGIRSNAVNADRVRTNIFSEDVIAARAKARNLTPEEYFKSNLLQQEVTPQDVAQGFLFLAQATKTTAGTLTVDGGNLEASLR